MKSNYEGSVVLLFYVENVTALQGARVLLLIQVWVSDVDALQIWVELGYKCRPPKAFGSFWI
jgi:hypothetical protein